MPQLGTSLRTDHDRVVLVVTGEIDAGCADEFRHAVEDAVRRARGARRGRLILDLTRARFLASVGITVLYAHLDSLAAVLAQDSSTIARALSISGFPKLITVRRDTG